MPIIEISNLVDLQLMIDDAPDWSGDTYIQTADIDATPTQLSTYGTVTDTSGVGYIGNVAGEESFLPIGDAVNGFNSSFDGQGFKITGLFSDRTTSRTALFGDADGSSYLSNINVVSCDFTGQSIVGGIVGILRGEIYKCSSSEIGRAHV